MVYDVRAIANFVLKFAKQKGRTVSNLQINKIVYFVHADYISAFDQPLVNAKIEAWTYGPVFRELYHQFKVFGEEPITHFATRIDPRTGKKIVAESDISENDVDFLLSSLDEYTRMSAGSLVNQSHIEGGPWDIVWNHQDKANPTMQISDEVIRHWHKKAAKH